MGFFGPKLDRGLDAFSHGAWGRARRLLEQTGQARRATGDYHLGLLYWRGLGGARNVSAAVECFARAAAEGHAAAQTAYGMALRSGVGVVKDNAAAAACFRSAAGAGDGDAMVQLATMSEPTEARRLLLRASELGHAAAMTHLADILMREDAVEALSWLYASVTLSGAETVRKRAAKFAREMSAAEIDAAQKAGRAYVKGIQTRNSGKK
jgi:TPR repeat protein